MLGAAARALRGLLDTVGHQTALDEELESYISSMLEDPDPETCVDVLVEVLASAVAEFNSLENEEQIVLVLRLLEQANDSQTQQHVPVAETRHDLDSVLSAFKQASLQLQPAACTDITNTAIRSSITTCSSGDSSKPQGLDVSDLLEVCPRGISREFLTHLVQQQFRGNLQAAADYLFECDDLHQQQQSWLDDLEQQEQQRRAAEQAMKQSKREIVERFDLQVVSDMSKKQKFGDDPLPAAQKGEQPTKVRYRDGRIVSNKGEKYIIESLKEEWDGGSKGKVFTKGKRGKGFA